MPNESTILRFGYLQEKHERSAQPLSAICATLIAARSSAKNSKSDRDPEMHSAETVSRWFLIIDAHIGVDVDSGAEHTVSLRRQCQRHHAALRTAAR